MTRRLAAALASAAALAAALAGCGGGDGSSSALDDALGYLPEDAALAVAISTDVEGDDYEGVRALVERLPFGQQLVRQLRDSIEQEGVDYERDLKPLLGNDVVVGVVDARELQADDTDDFVFALRTKDGDKLEEVIGREGREVGERDGAKLYEAEDGDSFSAVDGDVLVVANTREQLERALATRDGDERLREDGLDEALKGLPEGALMRVMLDVEALLEADPQTASARRVEWISALRTLGLTFGVARDRVAVDFLLDTGEGELAEDDLPIAAGAQAPPVAGAPDEVAAGVRDPAQIVRFAERAAQAVDPEGFAEYLQGKRRLGEQLEVDVDRDVIGQFGSDTAIAVGADGGFAVRARVADPRQLERTLERAARVLPRLAGDDALGVATPRGDEDFYAIARPDGESLVFGVVDDAFVLADDPRRAARLAATRPRAVEGAKGAVVVAGDGERLADRLIAQNAEGGNAAAAALLTTVLGEFRGAAAADADGLRGSFSLDLD